jgi:tetratricopeptide (TPR) repeat protein
MVKSGKNKQVNVAQAISVVSQLYQQGRLSEIVAQESRLLKAFPKAPAIALILGAAHAGLGAIEAAMRQFHRAVKLNPLLTDGYNNLGVLLNDQNHIAPAVKCFARALMVSPGAAAGRYNLGLALQKTGADAAAMRSYQYALVADPLMQTAYYNLGNAHYRSGAFDAGIGSFQKRLLIQPGFFKAYNNLGSSFNDTGSVEPALQQFDRALMLQPKDPETHHNRSLALLKKGDFATAWHVSDWRWLRPGARHLKPDFAHPEWAPDTPYRRLLLWAEQGIGEEILFASVIAELRALCDQLIVLVDPRLAPLMARSVPDDIVFRARGDSVPASDYDAQISMVTACKYLRCNPAQIMAVPRGYLHADPVQARRLRSAIFETAGGQVPIASGGKQIIGLSWRSVSPDTGAIKSMQLLDLVAALAHPKAVFVSLQYGDTQSERQQVKQATGQDVIDLAMIDNYQDLDGLAATIMACDKVVSIANITADLAGALGQNVDVLLSRRTDWRWQLDSDHSIWYPSAQLYRRGTAASWQSTLDRLKADFWAAMD